MSNSSADAPAAVRPVSSPVAVASLALGIASFLLPIVTGLPALFVGYRALFAINGSGGRLKGRWLAMSGMALGGLTTAATVVGFIFLIFAHFAERSRFATVENNLRRVGGAINLYSASRPDNAFPPGTIPNAALAPEERLSWIAALLPYLDHGLPLSKKWEAVHAGIALDRGWGDPANTGALNTPLTPFLCLDHAAGQAAPTYFVGIAGVGPDAAVVPKENADAGFFGYDREITPADIHGGTSHTFMVLDTTDVGPWLAGGVPTVRSLPPAPAPVFGPFGGCHRGGIFALFVEGNVQFESEGTDPDILRTLARLRRE